ncbi:MAG TPA: divalent-cation tolerance protein CutA [Luteitalea sp.]|nr:divalent-cation tolerance protein CutA [Luteitalea sp.]
MTIQESIAADNADHADDVVIVLTTWPDDMKADRTARQLVEAHLAACVTRLPRHHVVYRWQGAIEEADEVQWVIKTTRGALDALWHAVRGAHPYDTPEWIVLTAAGGSEAYLGWVRACTAADLREARRPTAE